MAPVTGEHGTLDPAHIPGMTPLTTTEQVARIAAARRAHAKAAGRPVRRTRQRGMLLSAPVRWLLFLGTGGKLMASEFVSDDTAHGKVTFDDLTVPVPTLTPGAPVDFGLLERIMTQAHDPEAKAALHHAETMFGPATGVAAVFADRASLNQARKIAASAVRAAKKAPNSFEVGRVSSILEYRGMLAASGRLPVLTEALASAYWLPSGANPDNVEEWADSFGFTGSTAHRVVALLVAANTGPVNAKYAEALIGSERYGTISACFPGPASAAKAFRHLNTVADAAQALADCDALLVDLNTVTGAASKLTLMQGKSTAGSHTYTVSEGFKMKAGAKVILFNAGAPNIAPCDCTIKEVGIDPVSDEVWVKVTAVTDQAKSMVIDAQRLRHPLYMAAAPYLPFGAPPTTTGRWMSRETTRPQRSDMPIDVALAEAPELV